MKLSTYWVDPILDGVFWVGSPPGSPSVVPMVPSIGLLRFLLWHSSLYNLYSSYYGTPQADLAAICLVHSPAHHKHHHHHHHSRHHQPNHPGLHRYDGRFQCRHAICLQSPLTNSTIHYLRDTAYLSAFPVLSNTSCLHALNAIFLHSSLCPLYLLAPALNGK